MLWLAILVQAAASLSGIPEGWFKTGNPIATDLKIKVTFAIKQTNTDWLKEKLKAVSYPDSPEYGNYMNFDEITLYVYGRPESVQAVSNTLASFGVHQSEIDFTIGRDLAIVNIPLQEAEKLFSTEFFEFEHQEFYGLRIVTASDFTIPSILKLHVDFISGVRSFPTQGQINPRRKPTTLVDPDPDLGTTPETIARDYNMSDYVCNNSANSQAIAAFLKQYYDPSDLKIFQKKYSLPEKAIVKTVGENRPNDPGAEANLDVQYISATGRNVDTWFISISTYSNGKQEDFLSWIVGQVNTTDSPWVHSASYGDVERSIDDDYLKRVDNEFMKFGISGRTVLFASGDSGVACKGIHGKFTPNWPASSPYVTAVGGTVSLKEVWSDGGGGFSDYFPTPDYQKATVEAYLKSGKAPPANQFNSSGRAYPDVSAFATNFLIVDDGFSMPVDGTSCSAPTFAGIVSSLNDVRLNKGLKTLGFLNPLLYQTLEGQGFFDITEGSNGRLGCKGFEAVEGWDPASGWGSPNFGLLKALVLN